MKPPRRDPIAPRSQRRAAKTWTPPEDVVSGWRDAWNSANADALAILFADDADFVNVIGLWWNDRENIRAAHAFGCTTIFPGSTITMSEPHVRRLGESVAVVHSRWRLVGQVSPIGEHADARQHR